MFGKVGRSLIVAGGGVALFLGFLSVSRAAAPTQPATGTAPATTRAGRGATRGPTGPLAPTTLPGKGLAEQELKFPDVRGGIIESPLGVERWIERDFAPVSRRITKFDAGSFVERLTRFIDPPVLVKI